MFRTRKINMPQSRGPRPWLKFMVSQTSARLSSSKTVFFRAVGADSVQVKYLHVPGPKCLRWCKCMASLMYISFEGVQFFACSLPFGATPASSLRVRFTECGPHWRIPESWMPSSSCSVSRAVCGVFCLREYPHTTPLYVDVGATDAVM